MSQAEKLVSSEHSSSILAIRDNIERLKADIQELSLLSNKVDDALKVDLLLQVRSHLPEILSSMLVGCTNNVAKGWHVGSQISGSTLR